MARITVEDCLEVVNNRFELVMMASKRARQLANGVQSTIDNTDSADKPTVLALREIAARKIDNALIDEVEKAERERAERERWSGPPPRSSPTRTCPRTTTDRARLSRRSSVSSDSPPSGGLSRLCRAQARAARRPRRLPSRARWHSLPT